MFSSANGDNYSISLKNNKKEPHPHPQIVPPLWGLVNSMCYVSVSCSFLYLTSQEALSIFPQLVFTFPFSSCCHYLSQAFITPSIHWFVYTIRIYGAPTMYLTWDQRRQGFICKMNDNGNAKIRLSHCFQGFANSQRGVVAPDQTPRSQGTHHRELWAIVLQVS